MRSHVKSSSVGSGWSFRGDGDELTVDENVTVVVAGFADGKRERERSDKREKERGRRAVTRARACCRTGEFNFYVTLHLRSLIPVPLCASAGGREGGRHEETLDRRTPFAV